MLVPHAQSLCHTQYDVSALGELELHLFQLLLGYRSVYHRYPVTCCPCCHADTNGLVDTPSHELRATRREKGEPKREEGVNAWGSSLPAINPVLGV